MPGGKETARTVKALYRELERSPPRRAAKAPTPTPAAATAAPAALASEASGQRGNLIVPAGLPAPLTKGSVVASDAFFPFADGLLVAIEAGATAVIQPGGSMRDDEVIKAADEHNVAMLVTKMRHFRH